MFGLKIFVRVQTFRRVPPVLPCNFCHPVHHHHLLFQYPPTSFAPNSIPPLLCRPRTALHWETRELQFISKMASKIQIFLDPFLVLKAPIGTPFGYYFVKGLPFIILHKYIRKSCFSLDDCGSNKGLIMRN